MILKITSFLSAILFFLILLMIPVSSRVFMRSYYWNFVATPLDYATEAGSSLTKTITFDKAFDIVPQGLVTIAGFRFHDEVSTHEINVTLGTVTTTTAEILIKIGTWGRLQNLQVSVFFTNSSKRIVNKI